MVFPNELHENAEGDLWGNLAHSERSKQAVCFPHRELTGSTTASKGPAAGGKQAYTFRSVTEGGQDRN